MEDSKLTDSQLSKMEGYLSPKSNHRGRLSHLLYFELQNRKELSFCMFKNVKQAIKLHETLDDCPHLC